MRNFQPKRGWRNIIQSWPVLFFLCTLLIFFAWGVIGFMGKMQVTSETREIAENKVAELEKEKIKLSANISKLKSIDGVEESIRDKFGLAREGEGLIVVVEDKNKAKNEEKTGERGFFSFFSDWFK